jgi:hypothetical protein
VRGQSCDAYVGDVKRAANTFVDSDVLVDRAATVDALVDLLGDNKGTLSLLVGPRDVGKSHILRSLHATMDKAAMGRKVVVVSGRLSGANLARGIIDGVERDKPLAAVFFESFKVMAPALAAAAGPSEFELADLVAVLESYISACQRQNLFRSSSSTMRTSRCRRRSPSSCPATRGRSRRSRPRRSACACAPSRRSTC